MSFIVNQLYNLLNSDFLLKSFNIHFLNFKILFDKFWKKIIILKPNTIKVNKQVYNNVISILPPFVITKKKIINYLNKKVFNFNNPDKIIPINDQDFIYDDLLFFKNKKYKIVLPSFLENRIEQIKFFDNSKIIYKNIPEEYLNKEFHNLFFVNWWILNFYFKNNKFYFLERDHLFNLFTKKFYKEYKVNFYMNVTNKLVKTLNYNIQTQDSFEKILSIFSFLYKKYSLIIFDKKFDTKNKLLTYKDKKFNIKHFKYSLFDKNLNINFFYRNNGIWFYVYKPNNFINIKFYPFKEIVIDLENITFKKNLNDITVQQQINVFHFEHLDKKIIRSLLNMKKLDFKDFLDNNINNKLNLEFYF